ncbi:MAG: apolipoprotein N-acyltransferase [Bacteroidia bacterium]|nr:apolipoprotein N-acyltransferase [Bacteroidia bacterium]
MADKLKYYLIASLSGVLLWLGWPSFDSTFLLFIGWIPLLYVLDNIPSESKRRLSTFKLAFTALFTWNILTTWWIWNASPGGAVMAIIANSLLMSIPIMLFQQTKQRLGTRLGYWSLICFWIGFEYIHLNWELDWPWLTLGNGLAMHPDWVQWYEYTGHLGGSLWIWIINILLYLAIFKIIIPVKLATSKIDTSSIILLASILLLVISPITISKNIYSNYTELHSPVNIIVVQPNIDPYNEKFAGMTDGEQIDHLIKLSEKEIDDSTDYVIWPETAIPSGIWKDDLEQYQSYKQVKTFVNKHSHINLITGLTLYKHFDDESQLSSTARKLKNEPGWYDVYNTAMHITQNNKLQLYNKSKLVIGVEKVPYPSIFGIFESVAINLGGTMGSLGSQNERIAFKSNDEKVHIGPIICYESIFGEFVTEYIHKGANLLCIITNDGWWGNTPGYEQHLHYASLRAIETRRSIARCANTGTSCFIDQKGDISQATEWWEPAVIKSSLHLNDKITFYVKFGNYIGRLASFLAVAFFMIAFVRRKLQNSSI